MPRDHPEILRLEGRYKAQGGLLEGGVVQLANGNMAAVVKMTPDSVQLDANDMLASREVTFTLKLLSITEPAAAAAPAGPGTSSESPSPGGPPGGPGSEKAERTG